MFHRLSRESIAALKDMLKIGSLEDNRDIYIVDYNVDYSDNKGYFDQGK